jgi:hypothetical protein
LIFKDLFFNIFQPTPKTIQNAFPLSANERLADMPIPSTQKRGGEPKLSPSIIFHQHRQNATLIAARHKSHVFLKQRKFSFVTQSLIWRGFRIF